MIESCSTKGDGAVVSQDEEEEEDKARRRRRVGKGGGGGGNGTGNAGDFLKRARFQLEVEPKNIT